jgi:hypothetical protein
MGKTLEMVEILDSIGCLKQEIYASLENTVLQNLDAILDELTQSGATNGIWKSIYDHVSEENKNKFVIPEWAEVANDYAAGLLERMKERLYLNYNAKGFVEYIKKFRHFPKLDDQY